MGGEGDGEVDQGGYIFYAGGSLAGRALTSFMRRTPLTTTPRRQLCVDALPGQAAEPTQHIPTKEVIYSMLEGA